MQGRFFCLALHFMTRSTDTTFSLPFVLFVLLQLPSSSFLILASLVRQPSFASFTPFGYYCSLLHPTIIPASPCSLAFGNRPESTPREERSFLLEADEQQYSLVLGSVGASSFNSSAGSTPSTLASPSPHPPVLPFQSGASTWSASVCRRDGGVAHEFARRRTSARGG